MLQCGGGNNTSAALLREFFVHERKCEEHFKKAMTARTRHQQQYEESHQHHHLPGPGASQHPGGAKQGKAGAATTSLPSPVKPSHQMSPRARTHAFNQHSPRGRYAPNATGILPLITSNTDIASLRRSPRKSGASALGASSGSMGSRGSSPRNGAVSPFDLPHQGIGFNIPQPPQTHTRYAEEIEHRLQDPVHGRKPPYGRKDVNKDFMDDICGGGIACLHPAVFSRR